MSIKVATIVGARPQFIKSAILSKEFNKKKIIKEFIINTGQHYDFNMSNIFFNELKLKKPFINLNINKNSSLDNISNFILKLENVLKKIKPDLVIIFGDTDTTIAGAITSSKLSIPLMHIEAGLRSFDLNMPEEQNRKVSDHLSNFLITPTKIATKNLLSEGIKKKNIHQFGDIMYDTWLYFKRKAKTKSKILKKNNIYNEDYILVTVHRQSNTLTFKHIKNIINYLGMIKHKIIFPIHPRTNKLLNKKKYKIPDNIILIKPVGYIDMIKLQLNCKYVITDSGGMQKEAYFAKKNCYVLRNNTEWIELVKNKHSILIKDKYKTFLKKNKFNLNYKKEYYGSGDTAKKIANLITNYAKTI